MQLSTLLSEAKIDYAQGRKRDARQKLRQAVQLEPQNYKLWLALAKVSETSEDAITVLKHSQQHHPDQPDIQNALQKLRQEKSTPNIARQHDNRPLFLIIGALLTCLILFAIGYGWLQMRQGNQQLPDRLALVERPEGELVPQTAVQPQLPATTPTPQSLTGKPLLLQVAPRATWTVTPTPSPTPTNTPTVLPTFVSSAAYTQAVRPFGVGNNERWIDVNLFTQTLKAYEGDTLVYSTLVSSGLAEYPTVTGQFRIWLRFESQTMDGRRLGYDYYIENVPYVMYFFEDYAIHGAFWHNNFGNPMSHGCVNVSPADAEWLYRWASLGTWVNVHY